MTNQDLTGGSPDEVWSYPYSTAGSSDGVLWYHDCSGNWNQVWHRKFDSLGRAIMVNPQSGRCLDVAGGGTANGTNVQLWDCNGNSAQFWQPRNTGALGSPQPSRCIDLDAFGTTNGTKAQTWRCTGGTNQVWQRQRSPSR